MTMRWRLTSTKPRGCYLGLNFHIIKSMYVPMGACYFGRMLENWRNVQYVVQRGGLWGKLWEVRRFQKSVNLLSNWPKITKTICHEKCGWAYDMASWTPRYWWLHGTSKSWGGTEALRHYVSWVLFRVPKCDVRIMYRWLCSIFALWPKLFVLASHCHTLQSTSVDVYEKTIRVH